MSADADALDFGEAEAIKSKLDALIEAVEALTGRIEALQASVDALTKE